MSKDDKKLAVVLMAICGTAGFTAGAMGLSPFELGQRGSDRIPMLINQDDRLTGPEIFNQ